jgi:sugar/nucleoside kinase (ribokinase family)
MTILVVGDANADMSAALDRFPREGDDTPIAALGWGSGGSAANVAAALALLGDPVRLLARVGRDPAAEVALRVARSAGANLSAVQQDDRLATGLCFAAISPGGERTFFSFRGANIELTLPDDDLAILASVEWLHIAGHALLGGPQRATALALIDAATRTNTPISLDLCLPLLRSWRVELLRLLPRLEILFANELELAALAPDISLANRIEWLRQPSDAGRRGVGVVAAKLGARGCVVALAEEQLIVPAFEVAAVDTNGCGDAFVAGFLHAYARARAGAHAAATLANAMGALAAMRPGAAEALPSRAELQAFLAKHGDS